MLGIRDLWNLVPNWCRIDAELAPVHISVPNWCRIGTGRFRLPISGNSGPILGIRDLWTLVPNWCVISPDSDCGAELVPNWRRFIFWCRLGAE